MRILGMLLVCVSVLLGLEAYRVYRGPAIRPFPSERLVIVGGIAFDPPVLVAMLAFVAIVLIVAGAVLLRK